MTNYITNDEKNTKLQIGKLICLARTYPKHAKEMKSKTPESPLLFLKPNSSVIFDNDSIIFPEMSTCLHHEIELGVVIGEKCKNITEKEALNYVYGYCVCLDITARDIQTVAKKNGWPWGIAKGFDTFAPISNVILKEEILNSNNLDLELKVNGKIRQKCNTSEMIFTVEKLISYISNIMTLNPGDLIMTGTPEGVGEIQKGDILEAKMHDIYNLKVNVR